MVAANNSGFVTIPEAAKLLGVSPRTVGRLLDQGRIPFTKPRDHRRIRRCDVIAYRELQTSAAESKEMAVAFDHLAD